MARIRIQFDIVDPLIKSGKSYDEIATIVGVTRNSIGRFCRKHYGLLEDRGKSTRQSIIISQRQKEIIFGGLLGDLCIRKHTKTYRGTLVHSIKQLAYAKFIHNELNNLAGEFRYIKVPIADKVYDECQFTIRPNTELEPFYKGFYGDFNGKKDVPYNLSLLTPLAIAIWFMDDGFLITTNTSKTLGFSTCSFSLEGLLRMQKYLLDTYNIETIIRKNFYLIVRKKSISILKDLIAPYMEESMKYKIALD